MMPRLPIVGLPSYGLLVALGFVAALVLAWHVARWQRLSPPAVQDVTVWASLWGLLGAKLLLIVLEPRMFVAAPWTMLFQGGVFYGGFVTGAVAGWLRCRHLGLDPWAVADVIAPSLALAHAFGRVGCFLAGCCWGSPSDLPWAVTFSNPLSMRAQAGWPVDQAVHPTQLYESVGNLALLGVVLALLSRRLFPGAAWWTYVATYGALRFLLEGVRGDDRGSIGRFSTSQVAGLSAVVAGGTMLAVLRHRGLRAEGVTSSPDPTATTEPTQATGTTDAS